MTPEKFEQWADVELFGHNRIAGRVTEQSIGGCSFVRVDVPAVDGRQPFTKLFGPAAIYAMAFVDEETAVAIARSLQLSPIDEWSARRMLENKTSFVPDQPLGIAPSSGSLAEQALDYLPARMARYGTPGYIESPPDSEDVPDDEIEF